MKWCDRGWILIPILFYGSAWDLGQIFSRMCLNWLITCNYLLQIDMWVDLKTHVHSGCIKVQKIRNGKESREKKKSLLATKKKRILITENCTTALISHATKVVLKILQVKLQQYANHELPDVQAGLTKGRGTRDQIANIHWIIKKAREFQKKNLLLFYWLCQSVWLCGSQKTVENSSRDGNTRSPDLPPEKSVCRSGSNS